MAARRSTYRESADSRASTASNNASSSVSPALAISVAQSKILEDLLPQPLPCFLGAVVGEDGLSIAQVNLEMAAFGRNEGGSLRTQPST
ncbi:hypothetical protein WR25_18307 [Diploscapter pachys]|uniref:Uncharacterized protein n=1 Tax=Diploscapter pachys TaxID=2018661 RepID=A0A2A2K2S6_9BILA|nr:hypothetical protein WR25_18307 [Diploscapter pachys]